MNRSHTAAARAATVDQPSAENVSAEPVIAAPAEVAASDDTIAEPPENTFTATSAADSSSEGQLLVMKIGRNNRIAGTARYAAGRLQENAAGTPLLMQAIGAPAAIMAVRIIAR